MGSAKGLGSWEANVVAATAAADIDSTLCSQPWTPPPRRTSSTGAGPAPGPSPSTPPRCLFFLRHLHPHHQGLLLWASWALVEEGAGEGEVSVASTTGEGRRQVVGGLYWPSGLSLDMTR